MTKQLMIFTLALAGLFWITGCKPVTKQEAKHEATAQFLKTCANFYYEPNWFDGPIRIDVGGAAFAYKWTTKKQSNRDFEILVTVDDGGDSNVSLSGHVPDTPDPTRKE